MDLGQDFRDLLAAFAKHEVRYLLIGGYAVAFHARPRFTKDIDLWLEDTTENLARAASALTEFGAPPSVAEDLVRSAHDEIVWFGVSPTRVDLLKSIPGVTFGEAYPRRVSIDWEETSVDIISASDLITAKRAAGREQDLKDVELLERVSRIS